MRVIDRVAGAPLESPATAGRVEAAVSQEWGDGLIGSAPDPDRHLGRAVPNWAKKFNH